MASRPKALVYRSEGTICDGCAEAVAQLLETSPSNFSTAYCGPDEDIKLSKDALSKVDVFAVGGGPDVDDLYDEIKSQVKNIRDFVSSGGRYLGFCLGANLAGTLPGLGILPPGSQTDSEIDQPGAQVTNSSDTVIQVDWNFTTGAFKGTTQNNVWLYFQDGAVIEFPKKASNVTVVARYSSNGDIAASISPFGKGWVGLVGPHPEATEEWYEGEDFTNPDGVNPQYGFDLVEATWQAGRSGSS